MARKAHVDGEPITIKKYANRRLYNTATSSYVTLEHLAEMIRNDEEFLVLDAKSGEDLTRSVLAQIIFDRESGDKTLLPLPFLRQLIGLYGDNMQAMVPAYLQSAMETFTKNQQEIRSAMMSGQGPAAFMPVFESMAQQNLALFEQTVKMFNPMADMGSDTSEADADESAKDKEIAELKAQLSTLQNKVNALGQ